MSNIIIINNFFNEEEVIQLEKDVASRYWELTGCSVAVENTQNPKFWYKNIIDTPLYLIFKNTIEKGIKNKIWIDKLYINGQAHSQCGTWHTDVPLDVVNCFTLVFFYQKWLPEYGGHLLIKTENVISILPEYNKAVLFDSTIEHVGLEPTVHCKTQRESIACKFRIINE